MKLLSLQCGKSKADIDFMLFTNTGNRDQVFYFKNSPLP